MEQILQDNATYTWDNLIQPMEELEERLHRVWSPVNHMNAVVNTDALRAVYNACLPKLSAYETELGQNERLFQAYQSIADGEEFARLDTAQKKVVQNTLRDFKLTGIDLDAEQKDRFKQIMQELSSLMSTFEEHVLDATHGWHKHMHRSRRPVGSARVHTGHGPQGGRGPGPAGVGLDPGGAVLRGGHDPCRQPPVAL